MTDAIALNASGHFPGCHPEHDADPRETPAGEIQQIEPCWHCSTPTERGACRCPDCLDESYIPQTAMYHCPTCRRWWAWMTGLNVTTITFGDPKPEATDD